MNLNEFAIGETVIRHGDVLLKRSDKKGKGRYQSRALLYQGVNHHHRLEGGSFRVTEGEGGFKLLEVKAKTKLTHEEHKALPVAPGSYEVDIEREFDHWAEEARRVID